MVRYKLRATGASGPVAFQERLTIDAALAKIEELRSAGFTLIAIINVLSGVEITDVDALLAARENADKRSTKCPVSIELCGARPPPNGPFVLD